MATSSWQLQHAKAKFSEFLDASIERGPQIVTRRGVDAAVLIGIAEWRRLQQARPGLKQLLLSPESRFDNFDSPRGRWHRRASAAV